MSHTHFTEKPSPACICLVLCLCGFEAWGCGVHGSQRNCGDVEPIGSTGVEFLRARRQKIAQMEPGEIDALMARLRAKVLIYQRECV